MKVYVFPADAEGTGHYRLFWPAHILRLQGHDVTIVPPSHRHGSLVGNWDERTGRLMSLNYPAGADVIVIQRPTHHLLSQAPALFHHNGIACVVDMDDDLSRIDPRHPGYANLDPAAARTDPRRDTWRNAERACAGATLVTVSTPRLLEVYATHGRGVVLRNCVPGGYVRGGWRRWERGLPARPIGWGGNVFTHPGDLEVLGDSVARLATDAEPFQVVGPASPRLAKQLGTEHVTATGSVKIEQWPAALSTLGIGVVPLADTRFNAAKSWLKGLEYAALGVPFVATPLPEYEYLHSLGAGLLAAGPRRWARRLEQLSRDERLRRRVAEAGLRVAQDWTY